MEASFLSTSGFASQGHRHAPSGARLCIVRGRTESNVVLIREARPEIVVEPLAGPQRSSRNRRSTKAVKGREYAPGPARPSQCTILYPERAGSAPVYSCDYSTGACPSAMLSCVCYGFPTARSISTLPSGFGSHRLRLETGQSLTRHHSSLHGSRDICRDGPSASTAKPSEKFEPIPCSGSYNPGSTEKTIPGSSIVESPSAR